jgi:pilus assembly protein CpaB
MQVISHNSRVRLPRGQGKWNGRGATLALALAAGLAAALLAFLMVRGRLAARPIGSAAVPVVVAKRDIPARTRLTSAWLQVRSVPPTELPDGAVGTAADLLGKVTTEPIVKGAAVTLPLVTTSSASLGMAFALPPSQRAMTVALDPADSADQFARPGDHVDLLATDEAGGGLADARTVLQNVRLLAVGAQTSPEATPSPANTSGPAHITVAVSPAQAQALVLAAARGKLHLSLRPVDDEAIASLPVFPVVAPVYAAPRPIPTRLPKPHRSVPRPVPEQDEPLPPLPVSLPLLPPAHVPVLVIKGSQSQTLSVEP